MDVSIAEVMEKDRVEKILESLREGHKDPEYRRAVLVELFERGQIAPVNDFIN